MINPLLGVRPYSACFFWGEYKKPLPKISYIYSILMIACWIFIFISLSRLLLSDNVAWFYYYSFVTLNEYIEKLTIFKMSDFHNRGFLHFWLTSDELWFWSGIGSGGSKLPFLSVNVYQNILVFWELICLSSYDSALMLFFLLSDDPWFSDRRNWWSHVGVETLWTSGEFRGALDHAPVGRQFFAIGRIEKHALAPFEQEPALLYPTNIALIHLCNSVSHVYFQLCCNEVNEWNK